MAAHVGANDFVDAAACGDLDGVKRLLEDGSLSSEIINAIDKDGRSAFHYGSFSLSPPLKDDRTVTLTILFRLPERRRSAVSLCGVRLSGRRFGFLSEARRSVRSPLFWRGASRLRILLGDARVDVTKTSPKGDTGLHMAALYAAQEAMKLLFDDGRVDVNAQNSYGETPMHLCAGANATPPPRAPPRARAARDPPRS